MKQKKGTTSSVWHRPTVPNDALNQKNGILGLNFYPLFLGDNVYEKIYQNIYFLCKKGFEDMIAIGSDFDGAKMDKRINCSAQIPNLYNFLIEKGLKKNLLDKIFYLNAKKFIAKL